MTNQQPPADELAAIRAEIRRLEEREREIKDLMIADRDNKLGTHTGNKFLVEITDRATTRTDYKEYEAMHPGAFDAYRFKIPVTYVELFAINQDTGEIVRPRRARETTDG